MVGTCKCGNKPSSSLKCGEFHEDGLASQEGLDSVAWSK